MSGFIQHFTCPLVDRLALSLDQAAYAPEKRIKPKRALVVVLGILPGLMLGILAAFLINFLEKQKQEPYVAQA